MNELTLKEKLQVMAIKLNEEEFSKWLHNQIIGLAEYMKDLGMEEPYETARKFVLDSMETL